jgi:hypothetical protein
MSLIAVYNDAVANIRFAKQQQWRVTNYAALIYGAVVLLLRQEPTFASYQGPDLAGRSHWAHLGIKSGPLGNATKRHRQVSRPRYGVRADDLRSSFDLKDRAFWSDPEVFIGLFVVSTIGAAIALTLILSR